MKYKGYELMKAVAEGKLNLKQKVSTTSLEYTNCTIEFVLKDKAFNIMDLDFEILEDNTEEIEELEITEIVQNRLVKEIKENREKINELVKAVNSIRKDKNNEMESKTND